MSSTRLRTISRKTPGSAAKSILDPATTVKINRIIETFIRDNAIVVPDRSQRNDQDVQTEITGLGPLHLINDSEINDILVNTYDEVYVETKGILVKTNVRFRDEEHLRNVSPPRLLIPGQDPEHDKSSS